MLACSTRPHERSYCILKIFKDDARYRGMSVDQRDVDMQVEARRLAQEFNDECFDAISVSNVEVAFSTHGATTSVDAYNDAQCSGTYLGEMFADVWFSYTAVCTGTLRLSTCNNCLVKFF